MYTWMYIQGMTRRYSIAQARARLPGIVDESADGPIELTRRGKRVAVIVSPALYEILQAQRPTFADAYRAFVARHPLTDVGLEPAALEELRSRDAGRVVDL
ncbi:MAG: type II toxin-antitoxin system Phd/YefM family antitoxin [Deltaproteobacteria bacterium]|nr:type II toxin-antitoxin system Phd/YefM family antitoxin [Deltaproteobacteria bacterium]